MINVTNQTNGSTGNDTISKPNITIAESGLNKGTKVAIGICIPLAAVILTVLIVLLIFKYRNRGSGTDNNKKMVGGTGSGTEKTIS